MKVLEVRGWATAAALLVGCGFAAEGTGQTGGSASGESSGGATVSSSGTSGTSMSAGSETSTSATSATTTGTSSGPTTGSTTTDGSTTGSGSGGSTSDALTSGGSTSTTGSVDICHPMFAEIFMSVSGSDAGREWVVLYNPCAVPIDFGNYSVAWGDDNFDGAVDLVGTVGAGECFVLGGPTSDAGNFMPVYDQQSEFNPQLWRDFGGLGIYEAAAATVTATSVPVDVFVWGPDNTVGWVDPDGNVAAVTHAAWPADISLRRTAPTTWVEGDPPTPNACPTFSL